MEKTVENSAPQHGKKAPHRGVYVLPNLITSLSMFMGFLCMVWAVQGRFEAAVYAVFLSALLDGMDGKVARLTGTASEFGVQYDSLADLVAFGVAPAMLMWQWQLEAFGRWGVAVAFVYAACGALRLARFNVSTTFVSKRFFIGLPIPAGGCTLATFVLFSGMLPDFLAPAVPYICFLLVIFVGLLMVSRVRYFSFKEYDFLRAHPIRSLVGALLALALVYSQPLIFAFLFCALYIAGGIVYTLVILPRRNRQLLRALSSTDD